MPVLPIPIHPPVSVFIAAADERVRSALWNILASEPGVEPTGATADLADLIRLLGRVAADVIVLHESVFGATGLEWLPVVSRVAPHSAIVIAGMHEHPAFTKRVRDAGAADYVRLDDAERLGSAVVGACERSAPLAAGRRRTGRRAVTVVPAPGAASITRLPLRSSTRSRIPTSPNPSGASDGSNP
jgi:DNA-binding NarL/FixJ family response regulator